MTCFCYLLWCLSCLLLANFIRTLELYVYLCHRKLIPATVFSLCKSSFSGSSQSELMLRGDERLSLFVFMSSSFTWSCYEYSWFSSFFNVLRVASHLARDVVLCLWLVTNLSALFCMPFTWRCPRTRLNLHRVQGVLSYRILSFTCLMVIDVWTLV